MSPHDFFRLVRRGWPILLAFLLIGAAVGFGTTLRSDDASDVAVETFWEARRTVVVDALGVNRSDFELSQQALFATGGEVPATVADQLGLDSAELVGRLRSVTDVALGSITLVVVAETSEEADAVAALTAEEFVAIIGQRERAQFINEQTLAENEVARLEQVLIDLDADISEQQAKLAADEAAAAAEAGDTPVTTVPAEDKPGGGVTESGADDVDVPVDLRDLELQRDSASQRYADAVDEVDRRSALPDPVSPLSVLSESAGPIEITDSAFAQRLRAGEAGQRNYLARDVSLETERVRPIGVTSTNTALRTIMGAVAGLLLGLVLIIARTRLDPRVRTTDEAQLAFQAPVLAEIPALSRSQRKRPSERLVIKHQPFSESAERFRRLRVELELATERQPPAGDGLIHRATRVIVVVGTAPSDSTSFVAANLAHAYVETSANVALFDFDHRQPIVHELFDTTRPNGDFAQVSDHLFIWSSKSQTAAPAEIVLQQREHLAAVRADADVIIIAASPLITLSETLDLLEADDLVLPVFDLGSTQIDAIDRMRAITERNEMTVPGIVLTGGEHTGRSSASLYFSEDSITTGSSPSTTDGPKFSGFALDTGESNRMEDPEVEAPETDGDTAEDLLLEMEDLEEFDGMDDLDDEDTSDLEEMAPDAQTSR